MSHNRSAAPSAAPSRVQSPNPTQGKPLPQGLAMTGMSSKR
jgi:hydroxymethylglutaryl-CoA reductase (NADPH)